MTDAVFPDWSPYSDLSSAAKAYLRDPDLALADLSGLLADAVIVAFTLERFVNETNGVWQEVAVCDGNRLLLWHGEDVTDAPTGTMTSAVRVLPLTMVTEVGIRRRLVRELDGGISVDALDVYVVLGTGDEPLRFVKTPADGGSGQMSRLEEFGQVLAALIGRPL